MRSYFMVFSSSVAIFIAMALISFGQEQQDVAFALNGAERLEDAENLPSKMIDGINRFVLRNIAETEETRATRWPARTVEKGEAGADAEAQYQLEMEPRRIRLRKILGMRDSRVSDVALTSFAFPGEEPSIAKQSTWMARLAQWQVFPGIMAEGLIVEPTNGSPSFCAVLIPDASQTPEEVLKQTATIELANRNGLLIIPSVVQRTREARNGRTIMSDQEFIYRSAFVLGRHLVGYQVSEALAAVDYCKDRFPKAPVLVAGWGEGGWLALFAAAVDTRIDSVIVSGHFGSKATLWNEPLHRNLFGLLNEFGDAELAAMVAPRTIYIDPVSGPTIQITGKGEAPGTLNGPTVGSAREEAEKAVALVKSWGFAKSVRYVEPKPGTQTEPATGLSLQVVREWLQKTLGDSGSKSSSDELIWPTLGERTLRWIDAKSRRLRNLGKWDSWNQSKLELAHQERELFWKQLDTSSPQRFAATVEPYRTVFRDEVIGRWETPKLPANPRAKLVYNQDQDWQGFEVVLDVFPDVFANGVLLVPKNLKQNEQRPCVVFQHGLESVTKEVIEGDHYAYRDVAAKLVKEGYIVFAPQNPYLYGDRFRTLQRKSNLLGKTLFSTIVAQHEQIVSWLGSLPNVDKTKIAFYGLSYGGKTAMRVPSLVEGYCLSICSADFNDWVWKNATTHSGVSYVWTYEYEIFEFGLGPAFNYAEMATLIAPRPFMVERGHLDTVGTDERVGMEFAKVLNMYQARLGLVDRAKIEWFVGPHTINGKGTFDFLAEHLKPK